MGLLDKLFGNDHQRAATRYEGRESATDRAARLQRTRHHRAARKADRQGQAWEDRDRTQERRSGTWYRAAR